LKKRKVEDLSVLRPPQFDYFQKMPKAVYQSSAKKRLTQLGGETFDAPDEWMKWHSTDSQDKREQENAPYLKETSAKKPERIGGIRIN